MNRYRQTHTRHWILAAIIIGSAAWVTHALTSRIGHHGNWSVDALTKYFPNLERAARSDFSPISEEPSHTALQLFKPAEASEQSSTSEEPTSTTSIAPTQTTAYAHQITYEVKKGDTLERIFRKHEFDRTLPFVISKDPVAKALSKLSIGKTLEFNLDASNELKQIVYPITALDKLIVTVDGATIDSAVQVPLAYEIVQVRKSGIITSSLHDAALESGVSIAHIMDMVRIFGWDIDFVLDIRSGDEFHMIYEDFMLAGEKIADGALLAAEFTTQGNTYRALRFDNGDDEISYFAPNGESMLGTFLRSPVEFSRISSRFGQRKHPILKTWRAHNGVDYAAGRGTPIRSTADGKIIHAGPKGGYGNTVIVSHAGRFSTLYAHMSGFAKGIKSGARIKQGQVIGYIGSTGLATGPHLHYEFRLDGVHRNPLTYKTPKATAVNQERRAQFDQLVASFSHELDQVRSDFASNLSKTSISDSSAAFDSVGGGGAE